MVYVAKQDEDVYSRVALHDCTVDELRSHLKHLSDRTIDTLCVRGPKAIRVVLTDEVLFYLQFLPRIFLPNNLQ